MAPDGVVERFDPFEDRGRQLPGADHLDRGGEVAGHDVVAGVWLITARTVIPWPANQAAARSTKAAQVGPFSSGRISA